MGLTHLSGFGAQEADWEQGRQRVAWLVPVIPLPMETRPAANAQSQVPGWGSEHTEGRCGVSSRLRVGVGLCGRVISL